MQSPKPSCRMAALSTDWYPEYVQNLDFQNLIMNSSLALLVSYGRGSVLIWRRCDVIWMTSSSCLHNRPSLWSVIGDAKKAHRLKTTQQGAARAWHRGMYSNWPTRGSIRPGRSVISKTGSQCLLYSLRVTSTAKTLSVWNDARQSRHLAKQSECWVFTACCYCTRQ